MSTIATSDGIYLHRTDDGGGPPVVLIAGFTASAETGEPQRKARLAAGFRVLCLDRRSHGNSDNPAYGQRMARHGGRAATAATNSDDQPDLVNEALVPFLAGLA